MSNKRFVRLVCVILAAVMLFTLLLSGISAFAVSQSDVDALEKERQNIRDQQADVIEQLDSLESEKASVIERKEALDKQNELYRQEIELINDQIEIYDQMIADKAEELEQAREAEEKQFEIYCQRVRAMEENSTWSYISFIFKADGLADMLARLDDIMDIIKHDQALEDEYIEAREFVEKVKAEYEEIQAEQQAKKTELTAEKEKLEAEIESAYLMISELEKDIEEYKKAYEANELLEVEVQNKIDETVAALEKQKAQEEANKYQNSGTGSGTGSTGSSNVGANAGAGYYWPCPSSAYITSVFGYRVHPIFGTTKYHSGVDIAANAGSNICAAASGTVAIAEYSASYGNYVVIYHANGMSTLYAHMSSMAVSAGQSVSQGQLIGYVGSTGWSTGPHLHFEVRVNGSCVDPLSYYSMSFSYSSSAFG